MSEFETRARTQTLQCILARSRALKEGTWVPYLTTTVILDPDPAATAQSLATGDATSLPAEQLTRTLLGGGALVVELTLHATAESESSAASSGVELPGVDARGHSSEKRMVEFFMACKFIQPGS